MLDLNNILRFLTKKGVNISIEEFLFLSIVRVVSNEDAQIEGNTTLKVIKLYYEKNTFYGRDLYKKEDSKINDWNVLIEKLVKQEFLLDYRKNKNEFNIEELQITENFKSLIFKDNKEEVWDDFYDIIVNNLGTTLYVKDTPISYFSISSSDKSSVKNVSELKDYFWKNICKGGDLYEIEKFFYHVEFTINHKKGIYMKVVNFLMNYHEGTLKKEIENDIKNYG